MKWGDLRPSTLADMVQSCVQNAQDAARDEAEARRRVERYQPGDAALVQAQHDVVRFRADQWHWRSYAEYYRKRAAKEGPHATLPLPAGMERFAKMVRPAPVAVHDQRLPREAGSDDDEVTTVEGAGDDLPF